MPGPSAATITVSETLNLLDGPYASVAEGVADGRYAFWLGSGISLGRVPGLKGVVAKVIEFVRTRINPADVNCKFAQVMGSIFGVASATAEERARSDLSTPFSTWPDRDAITARLVGNYSTLLGINVPGEPFDYLVWNAVDVVGTYADAALVPDVEHFCIAALSLEGAAADLVSANWDPLIERAVSDLTGDMQALAPTVVARPSDVQLPRRRTRLIKLHGCAALAQSDQPSYRQWLVATNAQVAGWCGKQGNAPLVTALVALIGGKPTLMFGLSAQDANIQHVFATAAKEIAWDLAALPPSYVFSEDELGWDQQALLQNVYGGQVDPGNFPAVLEAARIRAYAKPLLTALLIDVLARKIQELIRTAPAPFPQTERNELILGVRTLRAQLANAAKPELDFVQALLSRLGRASQLVRAGRITNPAIRYLPISQDAIHAMQGNPDLDASGIREASVALGLLGSGVARGDWSIEAESLGADAGMLAVTSSVAGATRSKIYITANATSAASLRAYGHLNDSEAPIILQAGDLVPAMSRAPRMAAGRTGLAAAREVSITNLLQTTASFDELYQNFRREVVI